MKTKTNTITQIGRYLLPRPMKIKYKIQDNLIIVIIDESPTFVLIGYGETVEQAFKSLEEDLEDAIKLYVYFVKPENLEENGLKFRELLIDIEKLNNSSYMYTTSYETTTYTYSNKQ